MGLSLLEVLVAFVILVITVLTIFGYTAMIHRASTEGKHQALASTEARAVLEQLKDSPDDFELAATTGYRSQAVEYQLTDEVDASKNEQARKAAVVIDMEARARHIAGSIYSIDVTANWLESGRLRKVVLETRTVRPGR